MVERPMDSIFWIEVEKIRPNPFQPRREFNEDRLRDLADSIRQYGILQPLAVTRKEVEKEDGGLAVEYELIAGERRWRAAKIANLSVVPALIRTGEDTDKMKLEMAIIENLQREDLNPVDRAQAFNQLVKDFSLKHAEVAKRIGKSREYVSNSIRILNLPQEILDGIVSRQITEGHTKPILMLIDRPEEQLTLFKEIVLKKLTVREAESIARRIAYEKVRKKELLIDPNIVEVEGQLSEKFGTRVKVEQKENGGRVTIDFFTNEDLQKILNLMADSGQALTAELGVEIAREDDRIEDSLTASLKNPIEEKEEDDDLYYIKNFSV
jgi:ParB family chromosome partitioning protein